MHNELMWLDSILVQQRREYHSRIQNAAMQAFQASIERTICQDLRSLLPGASTSSDNVEGELMRRAKALAKLPEHHEFIKRTRAEENMQNKRLMCVQDMLA